MSGTNYLEQKALDHALGTTTWTKPTAVYMALHTADPGDAGTGSEVTGGSYVPQAITFGATASPSGTATSTTTATFTGMPAATVTHFSIRENTTTGNALFVGPLGSPQTVSAGGTLQFAAGQVTVTAD